MLKDFYHLKRDNNPHRDDAFTLSCLGKIHPASSKDFLRCGRYLSDLLDKAVLDKSAVDGISVSLDSACDDSFCYNDSSYSSNNGDEILIIGLTESGIIPSLLMYIQTLRRNLNSNILYSTRRPLDGIAFKEKHSHGPDHILPLPECTIKEIWIVEDEITSGNTVYNLMVQLCDYLKISRVRVFAFADFRDCQQKREFFSKTAFNNIRCTVHTLDFNSDDKHDVNNHPPSKQGINVKNILNRTNDEVQNNLDKTPENNRHSNRTKMQSKLLECTLSKRSLLKKSCSRPSHIFEQNIPFFDELVLKNWHLPEKRPALAMKKGNFFDTDLWKLPSEFSHGTILAIGESVDLAACFALANENINFQQISLSPWKIDHKSIFSRISFADRYYLYNYEQLQNSSLKNIFILCDPIDREIEQEALKTLAKNGIYAKPIFQISEQLYMESDLLS